MLQRSVVSSRVEVIIFLENCSPVEALLFRIFQFPIERIFPRTNWHINGIPPGFCLGTSLPFEEKDWLYNHYLLCLFTNHQPTAKSRSMWLLHSPTVHYIVQLSLHKLYCFSKPYYHNQSYFDGFPSELPLTNHRLKWHSPNITLHINQARCIWFAWLLRSARVPVPR